MTYRELLIGSGHARDKRLCVDPLATGWRNLTTLDCNSKVIPDVLCDLNEIPWGPRCGLGRLLEESFYDEIHAYEVLEHLGQQGDARAFFRHFTEIWRLLKPEGYLCATVPSLHSPWAWGDPSHRRLISLESLVFLDQSEYIRQLDGDIKSPMSDFRNIYAGDFKLWWSNDDETTFSFILQAVKPSRIGSKL
jgi:hypothetical protein